jgi:hypothetical protein
MVGDVPDRGAVTVEAALGVCSVVAVLTLAIGGMCAVLNSLRCIDAAGEAARLVSRGAQQKAQEAVARVAPTGATLTITVRGDEITTEVRAPPLGEVVPGWVLGHRAYAIAEPGTALPEQAP